MANQLKKVSFTIRTPEQLARPAIPYRPATPGGWVTEVGRVCAYETVSGPVALYTAWDVVLSELPLPEGEFLSIRYTTSVPGSRVLVCRDVTTTRWVSAQPAQLYVPPVGYRPPTVTTDYALGWNSGARSVNALTGSGEMTFSVPASAVGVAVGMNDADRSTDYREIKHGLLLSRGTLRVVESGTERATASYASGDTLKIKRTGMRVTYWVGGTQIYASDVPSTGPMFMDASLYSGGDFVDSPTLLAINGESAVSEASFEPMQGLATQGVDSVSNGVMRPLQGQSYPSQGGANKLLPLVGYAGDRPYADARGVMQPLTGHADQGAFVPTFAVSAGVMHVPLGYASMLSGTVASSANMIFPLLGFSADRPYAFANNALISLGGFAADRAYMQPATELPRAALVARTGVSMQVESPAPRMSAFARVLQPNAFEGAAPAASLVAAGGAHAALAGPSGTLAAEASLGRVAWAELTAPAARLEAAGSLGTLGGADRRAPVGVLTAAAGGTTEISAPAARLDAGGVVGIAAGATLQAPAADLEASGTVWLLGRAELRAPALTATPYGSAALAGPSPLLRASGSMLLAVVYEAYAVNLKTNTEGGGNEVTRYTDFPFTQIVRFGNHHYGVAPDGLYRLGGELDNGQPVRFDVQTSTMDFEADTRKTPVMWTHA